jgi:hypothetical protein
MTTLIVAFRTFTTAPKKSAINIHNKFVTSRTTQCHSRRKINR